MKKRGKKYNKALELLGAHRLFSVQEGVKKAKELAFARFDESLSVDIMLGVNKEKPEHSVRGSIALPHKFGKPIKIIAFAKGEQVDLAKAAGADLVGAEELVEKVLGGWHDFDYAVATPDLMGLVGKTAKILGPRNLLPNKKNNTVALELGPIIKELRSGLIFFKSDKNGQMHFTFGKKSQDISDLAENLTLFLKQLKTLRPATAKGIFIKETFVSSTMGISIQLDNNEFNK